jgi:hypothetical protein
MKTLKSASKNETFLFSLKTFKLLNFIKNFLTKEDYYIKKYLFFF